MGVGEGEKIIGVGGVDEECDGEKNQYSGHL